MKFDPSSARALMERTPGVLRALLSGLPPTWLDLPEHEGAWSPREIAAHMADLEADGWIPRVRHILEEGERKPLPAIGRERFRERYAGASIHAILDDFEAQRKANVEVLASLALDEAALSTAGVHPALGSVRLSQLLSTWAVHDLTHTAQIVRTLAAQYRDEVGPWIEYLSILRDRPRPGPA